MNAKIKKVVSLFLILAVLLGTVMMATGCAKINAESVKKDPEAQIKDSLSLTLKAFKKTGADSPLAYIVETLNEGAFTAKYGDKETTLFTNIMYFDMDEGVFSDKFTTETADEKTDIQLYLTGEDLAITLPAQSGGKTLGISFDTLMQDLKGADEFWAMTGMTYEQFETQFGSVIESLNNNANKSDLIELLKLKSTIDKIQEIFAECEVVVENKKVLTGTEDVNAINVTYTMTTEQMQKIINVLAQWFDLNYESVMESVVGGLAIEPEVSDSGILDRVSEMKEQLKAALEEMNANVKLTFSINPKNELLMKVECVFETTVNETKEYVTLNMDLGEDLRTSSEYQINCIVSSGIESAASKTTIGYQKRDSDGMYNRRIYCTVLGDDVNKTVECILKWNTKSEVYTAEFDSVNTNVVIEGDGGTKDEKLWFTIDTVTVNKEETVVGVHLEFDPSAEVPKMPEYDNIFNLTEAEWAAVFSLPSNL